MIQGKADAPVWVNITNDQVRLEDAGTLWGLDTKETQQEIWRRVSGDSLSDWYEVMDARTTQKPAVLCIGQAGENLSRIAVLMHDGANAAGQGGFGHHNKPSTGRNTRSGQGACGEYQFIVRAKGVDPGIYFIKQHLQPQAPAPDKSPGQIKDHILHRAVPRGEINP